MGEFLMRCTVAGDIAGRMQYGHDSIEQACRDVIHGDFLNLGGEGGVIAIDAKGKVNFELNCRACTARQSTKAGKHWWLFLRMRRFG